MPQYIVNMKVGNEINHGFLWEDGRISHPAQFMALLQKGISAVRDADISTRIILHYTGYKGADWFFGLIKQYHVDDDIIGLSYYPWWHGKSLDTLQLTLNQLATKYNKKMVITSAHNYKQQYNGRYFHPAQIRGK